ncbi:hypothetical protein ACFQPA_02045 [Halomarina halobia]|uniref:DUF4366 domain-containing protein n=1 Tax=Halomarina halobia TaxID=3033386 RepID=A0ABD6A5B3_9EURY|nr:hypothetical protein [Halomarina sp. PSR21]
MPDITVFKVDLSGSRFNAPFSRQYEGGEREESEGESGGGRGKLLAVVGLVVALLTAVGGFLAVRRFRGRGGEEDEEAGGEPAEFDPDTFETEEDRSNRKRAVAAVVGLAFLVGTAAVVKLRGGDEEGEEYEDYRVDVEGPSENLVGEPE